MVNTNIPDQLEADNPYNLQQSLYNGLFKNVDRLVILRVEKSLIKYIQTNSTQSLKLDPMNSYYRLLTHQIADYYQLGHILSNDGSSIVVFKNTDTANGIELPKVKLSDISIQKEGNSPGKQVVKPKLIKKDSSISKIKVQQKVGTKDEDLKTQKEKDLTSFTNLGETAVSGSRIASGAAIPSKESSISDDPALESERASREALYLQARERIFQASKDEEEDEEEDEEAFFSERNEEPHNITATNYPKSNNSSYGSYDFQRFNNIPPYFSNQYASPVHSYSQYPPPPFTGNFPTQFSPILSNQQAFYYGTSNSSTPNQIYQLNHYAAAAAATSGFQTAPTYSMQNPYFNHNDSDTLNQLNPYIITPTSNKYRKFSPKNHHVHHNNGQNLNLNSNQNLNQNQGSYFNNNTVPHHHNHTHNHNHMHNHNHNHNSNHNHSHNLNFHHNRNNFNNHTTNDNQGQFSNSSNYPHHSSQNNYNGHNLNNYTGQIAYNNPGSNNNVKPISNKHGFEESFNNLKVDN